MASFNNGNYPGAPSFENLLIQNLMGRLHLRPPYLETDSFLSHTFDDLLFQDDDPLSPDAPDPDKPPLGAGGRHGRSLLAREEAKLEKEIVRVIRTGDAREALKPNSGQSVAVGDHSVCVAYHEEPGSEFRVWEWHGHVMLFDDEDGFSPEYVYGNYFERVVPSSAPAASKVGGGGDGEEEGEEGGKEEEKGAQLGLRDLITKEEGLAGNGVRRVLHRKNLVSTGLGK